MFGSSKEHLDYNLRPSPEMTEVLIERAQNRIELRDDIEFLDGWPLPPDNEEVWRPEPITVRQTVCSTTGAGNRVEDYVFYEKVTKVESRATNSLIRKSRIRDIAGGLSTPLYITGDEALTYGQLGRLLERKPTMWERAKKGLARLALAS